MLYFTMPFTANIFIVGRTGMLNIIIVILVMLILGPLQQGTLAETYLIESHDVTLFRFFKNCAFIFQP